MRTESLPTIRQLPPGVVNKIAAGEVIERPASVVKELVENAVDAGATRIDVAVEQGGTERIRVVDNGCGIPPEQLLLAVASHATSKLDSADDLFCVRTLGFRGEALASMAEVSRLTLRSRPHEEDAGAQLEVVGGQIQPVAPCGAPPGTSVEVEQLFFNTPVRRKFLKTAQTEMGHINEAVSRIALAHPEIHFTLRHGERLVHDLPAVENWSERIASLYGTELAAKLLWIESADEPVRLSGYVAHPSENRSHNRMQYVFLNGRHIRDRALQHAMGEAYRGLVLHGRYAVFFLRLEMPPEMVDVNVHPTKLEVRFQDSGRLYSQLLGTVRTRFLSTDLTHALESDNRGGYQSAGEEARASAAREELAAWAKGQLENATADASAEPVSERQSSLSWSLPEGPPLSLNRLSDAPEPAAARMPAAAHPAEPRSPRHFRAMQVYNRYLIAESNEGVVIIDQHALHERVLYEQIRERVLSGQLEHQRLLVPETVDLASAELAAVVEHRELLSQLGLEVEPFGESTVLVSTCPAMLRTCHPGQLLRELADQLLADGGRPERRDVLDSLMHMMSCKAAIKAGDPLSPEEVEALVAQRELAQDAHHCPHGRPTALVFTREDLDKQFKRT